MLAIQRFSLFLKQQFKLQNKAKNQLLIAVFGLITLLSLAKNDSAQCARRIVGVASAVVVSSPTWLGNETNQNEFGFSSKSYELITKPITHIDYEASGAFNSFVDAEIAGFDGKKAEVLDGQKILPIELRNEQGKLVKAELIFLNKDAVFDKTGRFQLKTVIKIKDFSSKSGKKPRGSYKAAYYVKIQH